MWVGIDKTLAYSGHSLNLCWCGCSFIFVHLTDIYTLEFRNDPNDRQICHMRRLKAVKNMRPKEHLMQFLTYCVFHI